MAKGKGKTKVKEFFQFGEKGVLGSKYKEKKKYKAGTYRTKKHMGELLEEEQHELMKQKNRKSFGNFRKGGRITEQYD